MSVATSRPPVARQRRRSGRFSWTVIALISLAIAGYFVGQYATGSLATLGKQQVGLAANYAGQPWPVQAAFYIHIVSAGVTLAVGPFQFSEVIRRRFTKAHRVLGRVYLLSVAFASAAGFVMSFFSSAAIVGFFGFGSLAVLWAWTSYRGYRAIRAGDHASHQSWMIRSFALTFAAPTLRLWLGVLIGAELIFHLGAPDHAFTNAYAVVPFLCWLPNIVVAELLIRRRNLPGLRFSPSPTSRAATRNEVTVASSA